VLNDDPRVRANINTEQAEDESLGQRWRVWVVISRYHKIDGYDWIAMPLVGYLYAVDAVSEIPSSVDKEKVAALRDAYRRAHLT